MAHGGATGVARWIAASVGIAAVWLVVLVRTVPRTIDGAVGDYGFFIGVADRLRAGDTLYTQVWDNKDPLYFYTLAVARTAGAAGSWVLEILWIIVAVASVLAIGSSVRLALVPRVLLAAGATPLILIGMPYFMGSTHLPGVVLILAVAAAALGRRWLVAGVLLGLLLILKLVLAPIAVAVLAVCLISEGRRAAWIRATAGFVATTVLLTVVLAFRGELTGFLQTQVDNVRHAQAPIVTAEQSTLFYKVAQHIVILVNPHVAVILLTTAVLLAFSWWFGLRQKPDSAWAVRRLWWMSATSFVVAGLVIAATGKWFHHAQTFEISSILTLVLVVTVMTNQLHWRAWITVPITVVATFLFMGAPPVTTYADSLRTVGPAWQEATTTDPLTSLLVDREPTTIALIGFGNLVPRSGGLEDWTLVCRHIGQRPFHATWMFDETIACLPDAELVIVTNDYGPDPAFPDYTAFTDSVEEILARDYTCDEVQGFRLCTQN